MRKVLEDTAQDCVDIINYLLDVLEIPMGIVMSTISNKYKLTQLIIFVILTLIALGGSYV